MAEWNVGVLASLCHWFSKCLVCAVTHNCRLSHGWLECSLPDYFYVIWYFVWL